MPTLSTSAGCSEYHLAELPQRMQRKCIALVREPRGKEVELKHEAGWWTQKQPSGQGILVTWLMGKRGLLLLPHCSFCPGDTPLTVPNSGLAEWVIQPNDTTYSHTFVSQWVLSKPQIQVDLFFYDMNTVCPSEVHTSKVWFLMWQCLGVETFKEWSLLDDNWIRGG